MVHIQKQTMVHIKKNTVVHGQNHGTTMVHPQKLCNISQNVHISTDCGLSFCRSQWRTQADEQIVYCVSQCNQGIISDCISYYSNAEMHLLETLLNICCKTCVVHYSEIPLKSRRLNLMHIDQTPCSEVKICLVCRRRLTTVCLSREQNKDGLWVKQTTWKAGGRDPHTSRGSANVAPSLCCDCSAPNAPNTPASKCVQTKTCFWHLALRM